MVNIQELVELQMKEATKNGQEDMRLDSTETNSDTDYNFSSSGSNQEEQEDEEGVRNGQNLEVEQTDLLGALPDCLLVHILSLLPFAEAVATSVLSYRWHQLWTQLTHLRFSYQFQADFFDFVATVDRFLSQLASPKLHSFQLILSHSLTCVEGQVCSSCLESWIPHIYTRNPEKISISVTEFGEPWVCLPSCLFNCPSLTELTLTGNLNNVALDVHLPNLRKLEMEVSDEQHQLMLRLLESCPLLEDLVLDIIQLDDNAVLKISTPNLKSLQVSQYFVDRTDDITVVIDAPNLVYIAIEGELAFYSFVNILSTLFTAEISLSSLFFNDEDAAQDEAVDYVSMASSLFQGISCARSLLLCDETLSVLNAIHYGVNNVMPKFHNLTHLRMTNISDEEINYTTLLPASLLSTLEKIELYGLVKNDSGNNLLSYILDNAMVSAQLVVSVRVCADFTSEDNQLHRNVLFWGTVQAFQKVSGMSD